ncbi:MAG: hypothetical protein JXR39_14200 [Marinilabiliaceae bacterium]|nr:hypothetical protein [Marinilabiliaceae bacterium]
MKHLFLLTFIWMMTLGVDAQKGRAYDYPAQWAKVDTFEKENLPRSADSVVLLIHQRALTEQNTPQAVRSLVRHHHFFRQFSENGLPDVYDDIVKRIPSAREPYAQLLNAMAARCIMAYYQQERYRILNRQTDQPQNDIRLMNRTQLAALMASHFDRSLQNPRRLQMLPASDYVDMLTPSDKPAHLRSSLYDVLVWQAIEAFLTEDFSIDHFEPDFALNDPLLFADAHSFVACHPTPADTTGYPYRAFRLLQEVTRFRLSGEKNPEALYACEIDRLLLMHRYYNGEDGDVLFENGLKLIHVKAAKYPVSALAAFHLASLWKNQAVTDDDKLLQAVTLCRKTVKAWPKSEGGMLCRDLLNAITHPRISLLTESVYLPYRQALLVGDVSNVSRCFLSVFQWSEQVMPEEHRVSDDSIPARLAQCVRVHHQVFDVPGKANHHSRTLSLPMPALKPGRYMVVLADGAVDADFKGVLACQLVQVSSAAVFHQPGHEGLRVSVLNRGSGMPVFNARVQVWSRRNPYNDYERWVKYDPVRTDANGSVLVKDVSENSMFIVSAQTPEGTIWSGNGWQSRLNPQDREPEKLVLTLFTDRKIYRPGQQVHYKAILMQTDGKEASARSNQKVTITLRDVNGNEAGQQQLETNDFGSCSGSFLLSQTGLTGGWSLVSQFGSAHFSVEEYKRHKFEVELRPIEGAYALGDTLTLRGAAVSFSGVSIAGASGRFKVTKALPYRPYRSRFLLAQPDEQVAAGSFVVDANGDFSFKVITRGETSLADESFHYTVSVDVTDVNGEMQSAERGFTVGVRKVNVLVSMTPEWVAGRDSVVLDFSTLNFDGQPVPAQGLFRLVRSVPDEPIKPSLYWSMPQWQLAPDSVVNQYVDQAARLRQHEEVVLQGAFNTATAAQVVLPASQLPAAGSYRFEAVLSQDADTVSAEGRAIAAINGAMPFAEPLHLKLLPAASPDTVWVVVGSDYADVPVWIEVWLSDKSVKRKMVHLDRSQRAIALPVPASRPLVLSAKAYLCRHNRFHQVASQLNLPKTDDQIKIHVETLRDKTSPGATETVRVRIEGADGDRRAAEVLAGMYDASLDVWAPNHWGMGLFYAHFPRVPYLNVNGFDDARGSTIDKRLLFANARLLEYARFEWDKLFNARHGGVRIRGLQSARYFGEVEEEADAAVFMMVASKSEVVDDIIPVTRQEEVAPLAPPSPDVSQVAVRRNLNETAFFYPHLSTDSLGNVAFTYIVPESLTKWHLMMLAHNKDGQNGSLSAWVTTAKTLMVTPEVPRFVREKDQLWLNAKITNQSAQPVDAQVLIEVLDGITQKPLPIVSGKVQQSVRVDAMGVASVQWPLTIPEGIELLTLRVKAMAGNLSDGEEHLLPVLPNRVLVHEALPFAIYKPGSHRFQLDNLVKAPASVRHHQLTFSYTQNAAWEVLKALPYLMEYPYECSEQVFSRLFGYGMGQTIMANHLSIANALKVWAQQPDRLRSPLRDNEQLRSLVSEETPWQKSGENETANRQRLLLLLDDNATSQMIDQTVQKLQRMQLHDGGWGWFPGMVTDAYITRHILIGFGQLKKAGSPVCQRPDVEEMMRGGLAYLQAEVQHRYDQLIKDTLKTALTHDDVHLLYALSFYDNAFSSPAATALLQRLAEGGSSGNAIVQSMTALVLSRNGLDVASLMRSLREHAIVDGNGLVSYRTSDRWHWTGNPIESLALTLEAFNEIAPADPLIAGMQNKLVSLKRVQAWPTTRSTTMAVCGMMSASSRLFAPLERFDEVTVGKQRLDVLPDVQAEVLSGTVSATWHRGEITPAMGRVVIQKTGDTPSQGALHWSYWSPASEVKGTSGVLRVTRHLFVESLTPGGTRLLPVDEAGLKVGDRLVVRLEVDADQAFDYVHLKDMRSSLLEPEAVLSQYRWVNGLSYYQTVRDASMNFFIHHLPKGRHVLEYTLVVRGKGKTSNGFAALECMYAPEFRGQSHGALIETK